MDCNLQELIAGLEAGPAAVLSGVYHTIRASTALSRKRWDRRRWLRDHVVRLTGVTGWADWQTVLRMPESVLWDGYRRFVAAGEDLPERYNPLVLRILCLARGERFSVDRHRGTSDRKRRRPPQVETLVNRANPSDPERACLSAILAAAGKRECDPRHVSGVLAVIRGHGLDNLDALRSLDGPAIQRAVDASPRAVVTRRLRPAPIPGRNDRVFAHALLVRARASPALDPAPHPFQTHLCTLTHAEMDRFPTLWRFGRQFGRRLIDLLRDDADTDHVLLLAAAWAQSRAGRDGEATRRAHTAVGNQLLRLLRCRDYCDVPFRRVPWRTALPRDIDHPQLLSLTARLCAAHNRAFKPRGSHTNTMTDPVNTTRVLVSSVNSLVQHGVLFAAQSLTERAVQSCMQGWEAANTEHYAAYPVREQPVVTRATLNDDAIERLKAATRTAQEAVVLTMLHELGLRVGALANARLQDVWNASTGCVRERTRLREKYSTWRDVWLSPHLCTLLTRYIREERREETTSSRFLFPNPSHTSPDVAANNSTIARIVHRLCRRAHLPTVNCHMFRHWVINRLMERGNSLETVSKWIGHRNVDITYRSYYSPDVGAMAVESESDRESCASTAVSVVLEKANRFDRLVGLLQQKMDAAELACLLRDVDAGDPDPAGEVCEVRSVEAASSSSVDLMYS
jgi:hypothetical protein